jgi:dTDP-4-amino-4,6-dideoxygalactose transaminase
MPVHLYGLPADMPSICAVADASGVPIVEDAAQAHGATVAGRQAGSFGLGSFSFYATKNVAAGEGGVVTTDDDDLADRLRLLRNQGMRTRYAYEAVGHNWRLTELQAAVALPQLARLHAIAAARQANAGRLTELLDGTGLVLPSVPEGRTHAWHQYTALLPEGVDRGAVVDGLARRGVEVGIYYPSLVWEHPPYRDHPLVVRDETPVAVGVAARCLSLPVHQRLHSADVETVAAALRGALEVA